MRLIAFDVDDSVTTGDPIFEIVDPTDTDIQQMLTSTDVPAGRVFELNGCPPDTVSARCVEAASAQTPEPKFHIMIGKRVLAEAWPLTRVRQIFRATRMGGG